MTESGRMDRWLLGAVVLLCLIGVVMVYSSSAIHAKVEMRSETAYVRSHLGKLLLGGLFLFLCSRLPVRWLDGRVALGALGLSLAALLLLLLPLGLAPEVQGTRRFLDLKVIRAQPVEFARLGLVLFLASYLSRKESWMLQSWRGLLVPFGATLSMAVLTKFQPNLSSAMLLVFLGFALLFLAGQPIKRLALAAVPLVVVMLAKLEPYQLKRIQSFSLFQGGEQGLSYQVQQSLIALGSGGLFGQGIGQGLQKYFYLPLPHTDFILGIVGEETGFIGILILFTLYGFVISRGLRIARLAPDRFSELLALGLTLSLAMNFFLHSMVVLGLGPVTGVPLPLISHGGTSLLANLMAMGILLSISRSIRPEPLAIPKAWNGVWSPSRAE